METVPEQKGVRKVFTSRWSDSGATLPNLPTQWCRGWGSLPPCAPLGPEGLVAGAGWDIATDPTCSGLRGFWGYGPFNFKMGQS